LRPDLPTLTCSDKKGWQCTGAMPPFMIFMESKRYANRSDRKVIHLQIIQKSSKTEHSNPKFNDSEDRLNRRLRRLQAERDFDGNRQSKFD
jgi:hypothetical protein